MQNLDEIVEQIHESFENKTLAREKALSHARKLIRKSANTIRAIHRDEFSKAEEYLKEAKILAQALNENLNQHPDLFYTGYTQDALKEYAEASITFALINNGVLPTPEQLQLTPATYLKGLAEAVGELRRRSLDLLRNDESDEAEKMLQYMDDIYAVLVTMDYPDAITGGLRRLTDIVRSITERTRGDLTISIKQERLEKSMADFKKIISKQQTE